VLIPALLIFAALIALWKLPLAFSAILLGYYVLTSLYSFALKRVVMIDVVCLALLYTSRVIAGAAAMKLDTTFWILAFCMFIFLSLAFVKRYTELVGARNSGKSGQTAGRGYFPDDLDLLASLGGASGYLSVLVLALYINENANSQLYQSPSWMWAACPLLMYWLSRVWLLAHRGHMNDDPIIFAIRDRTSRWIGVIFLLVFAMASF
jgi:4-hydroxybenzoate polyprenyltransferase